MSALYVLFTIVSLIFGVITYIATNQIISSSVVIVISLLYFYLLVIQNLKKYFIKVKRYESCYSFINSFIISLSVKGSLLAAFDYVKLTMDKEYVELIDGLSTLNENERLEYLKSYYNFDIYNLFLSVVYIWIEQGGDIFSLSQYLINESRRNEDYLITCKSISKRKAVDFIVLWTFTLSILVILRFSLSQYYQMITGLLFYQISIVSLFVLVLLSVQILIMRITKMEIRGIDNV